MWRRIGTFICLGLVLVLPAAAEAQQRPQTITFGVVPQQSATRLAQLWVPVLEYLGRKTGYTIVFQTAPNIPVFEQRLSAGAYAMAYMNPYHYTVVHRRPGYVAFAREKDAKIRGILVTRKDSPYQDIEQLRGKTIAFPAPAAFAACVLTRAQFQRDGIAIVPKYVASHDSVYRTVAKGLYPAGGGIMRTFRGVDAAVRNQLRILWTSPPYTPHAFAAHPGLDADVVERVRDAMAAMSQDQEGRALLAAIGFGGIDPATDSEWDDVRALDIGLLDAWPEN